MPVVLRNPHQMPVVLPPPFRGVLKPGALAVLNLTMAQVLLACSDLPDLVRVEDAPSNAGPFETRYGPEPKRREVTGTSDTVRASDWGGILWCENGALQTITVDASSVASVLNDQSITFIRRGAGGVTVVGAGGVNVRNSLTDDARAQWSILTLTKYSDTEVVLGGDMAAVA